MLKGTGKRKFVGRNRKFNVIVWAFYVEYDISQIIVEMNAGPFTLVLFKNTLFSITDEMAVTICLTAYKPVTCLL
jgi:hypothetical protein